MYSLALIGTAQAYYGSSGTTYGEAEGFGQESGSAGSGGGAAGAGGSRSIYGGGGGGGGAADADSYDGQGSGAGGSFGVGGAVEKDFGPVLFVVPPLAIGSDAYDDVAAVKEDFGPGFGSTGNVDVADGPIHTDRYTCVRFEITDPTWQIFLRSPEEQESHCLEQGNDTVWKGTSSEEGYVGCGECHCCRRQVEKDEHGSVAHKNCRGARNAAAKASQSSSYSYEGKWTTRSGGVRE